MANTRIKWQPVILTFNVTSSQQKSNDALTPFRPLLERFDIKTIVPFIRDHTTHVVANKRNTANGLRALIGARYIVTETFISAIEDVASESKSNATDSSSPLELDFDGNWPDALLHVPPEGNEPSRRPL